MRPLHRSQSTRFLPLVGALVLLLGMIASPSSHGQPMVGGRPKLRDISGRPLPDRSLPVGVVTVRVARKDLEHPVVDTEMVAIVEAVGGDSRKRTAKTDDGGRATFQGLAPGSRFRGEINIDGETVKTETFTIPEAGGIRAMLIGGLGPEPAADESGASAGADDAAGRPHFTLGIVSGTAAMDATLPTGTLVVKALDVSGSPLAAQTIELGQVAGGTGQVQVTRAITDSMGIAKFTEVAKRANAAQEIAAAVVMSVGDNRFGTDGFAWPAAGGVRVELRVPERTSDPSILTIGPGGRIVLQLRDDALGFIETLPLVNSSGKIFDPGAGGIEIPLPAEAVNAEGAEGEHKIEVRKGIGVAVHGPIPPRRPTPPDATQKSPDEITFGFVLPVRGSTLKFEQRFPNGLGEFTFITEQLAGLSIDSAQLTGRQERELGGKKYWLMRGESVPPGGTLHFRVMGLPAADDTGKIIAAVLSIALLLAAIALSRNPDSPAVAARAQERGRLIERREKLFAELVTVESRRPRNAPASASAERDDLMRRLETVYRDVAALDERLASSR